MVDLWSYELKVAHNDINSLIYVKLDAYAFTRYIMDKWYKIEGIIKYCENNNLEIKKIYKDIGISDKDFIRKGYKEMLTDIENDVIDTIIVKDFKDVKERYEYYK